MKAKDAVEKGMKSYRKGKDYADAAEELVSRNRHPVSKWVFRIFMITLISGIYLGYYGFVLYNISIHSSQIIEEMDLNGDVLVYRKELMNVLTRDYNLYVTTFTPDEYGSLEIVEDIRLLCNWNICYEVGH